MSDLDQIAKRLAGLEAEMQRANEQALSANVIPEDAQWTLKEARIRLSHGINPKALTDGEMQRLLGSDRIMSDYALRKLREDEACPIRAVPLGGDLEVKRIPEPLVRRHLREKEGETRPAALKQI